MLPKTELWLLWAFLTEGRASYLTRGIFTVHYLCVYLRRSKPENAKSKRGPVEPEDVICIAKIVAR